ncbi:MAG: prolipoprotein diacylglyceryl transferase [bacterium]|nr:prolipoprotein diacylglyceryl transferase [bacterium]
MWRETGSLLTYSIVYGLSMVAHIGLAIWICRRRRIRIRVGIALGLCYVWGMMVGAHVLYDLLHRSFDWHNYLDPGYYFKSGMWGGPLAYLAIATPAALLLARDRRAMLDLIARTLVVPMMLAKAACFANGCCYGAASRWPWAVTFPPGGEDYTAPAGIARHPTQLYEILVLVIIQAVFLRLDERRWKGTLMAWLVMFYGAGRALSEVFRAAERHEAVVGPLSSSQVACLAGALVAGLALLVVRPRRAVAAVPATVEA